MSVGHSGSSVRECHMKIQGPFLTTIYNNPERLERVEFGVLLPGRRTILLMRRSGGMNILDEPPRYVRLDWMRGR